MKYLTTFSLFESGIRDINKIVKDYKEAVIYFHIDLDGVTSAIGMKSYLEKYGIKVTDAVPVQYGDKEFTAHKPKPGVLPVMVDFAHGKPIMKIHTDHHDSQIGVEKGTSHSFKKTPSNAETISYEISPSMIWPDKDMKIISMVDSADFAKNNVNPDEVMNAVFKYNKKSSVSKNVQSMGLVVNKVLLAFKNKPGFLEELVLKANPSLINMFTVITNIVDNDPDKYPIEQLNTKTKDYVGRQSEKEVEIQPASDLANGEYFVTKDNIIVQYGGGYMSRGGYDRYVPFKLHPESEFLLIGWPIGLVQMSGNPFNKKENPYHLGDIATTIIDGWFKKKYEKKYITFLDLKKENEVKRDKDSFGFTYTDLVAALKDKLVYRKGDSAFMTKMIKDIGDKPVRTLSDKQKAILDSVEVSFYDIVKSQSGGHKGITNISGLSYVKYIDEDPAELTKEIMEKLLTGFRNYKK